METSEKNPEIFESQSVHLRATTDNPIPVGVEAGMTRTSDGASIRYARWEAKKRPSKGTVIVLQGRSEYIEKYCETIEDIRERGFGVLSLTGAGRAVRPASCGIQERLYRKFRSVPHGS